MINFEKIDSRLNKKTNLYGKFSVLPLKKGSGITIGNSLRRVLLSDLPGIAITAAKINNIQHEFSTISGIREDVLEILLNLKQIVLNGTIFRKTYVNLTITGPKIITANDIELPYNLKIINNEQYIAAICINILFTMELEISSGVGYKIANPKSIESLSNFIELDAIFMPVHKVNYYVENIYIQPLLLRENLIIEIWTNGSILPEKALKKSSEILIHLFSTFINEYKIINSRITLNDTIYKQENFKKKLNTHFGIILHN
jgi:DNA-directed RNA polymerase subunit alpha